MTINEIKAAFEKLGTNPDFLEVYNLYNGTSKTSLTVSEVQSIGYAYNIVKIQLKQDTLYLTDCGYDILYNGNLYLASGDFMGMGAISDSKEINNKGLSVTMANIKPEFADRVTSGQFKNAPVELSICFINPNTGVPEVVYSVFSGSVDSVQITLSPDSNGTTISNSIKAELNSIWEILASKPRAHCSDAVHRSTPGNENDMFFSRIGKWNSEEVWKSGKR